jgi:hypothetical protein
MPVPRAERARLAAGKEPAGRVSVAGRSAQSGGEKGCMASPSDVERFEQLERHLLRTGVGALEAERSRCADCGRTPLTGEHVHLYESRAAHEPKLVCELCRQLRRELPLASELVRHSELGHAVKLTVRAVRAA